MIKRIRSIAKRPAAASAPAATPPATAAAKATPKIRRAGKQPQPAAAPEPAPKAARSADSFDLITRRFGLPGALARQIVEDLEDLRPYWPILLPILIWVVTGTYRRERALFLAEKAARQQAAKPE